MEVEKSWLLGVPQHGDLGPDGRDQRLVDLPLALDDLLGPVVAVVVDDLLPPLRLLLQLLGLHQHPLPALVVRDGPVPHVPLPATHGP